MEDGLTNRLISMFYLSKNRTDEFPRNVIISICDKIRKTSVSVILKTCNLTASRLLLSLKTSKHGATKCAISAHCLVRDFANLLKPFLLHLTSL